MNTNTPVAGRLIYKSSLVADLRNRDLDPFLQMIEDSNGVIGRYGNYVDVSRVAEGRGRRSNVVTFYNEADREEMIERVRSVGMKDSSIFTIPGRVFMLEGHESDIPDAEKKASTGDIGIIVDVPYRNIKDTRKSIKDMRETLRDLSNELHGVVDYDMQQDLYSLPAFSVSRRKVRDLIYSIIGFVYKLEASPVRYATGYYRPVEGSDAHRGSIGRLEEVKYKEFVARINPIMEVNLPDDADKIEIDPAELEDRLERHAVDVIRRRIDYELPVIILPDNMSVWMSSHHNVPMRDEGRIEAKNYIL